jgi:hypothetical protein
LTLKYFQPQDVDYVVALGYFHEYWHTSIIILNFVLRDIEFYEPLGEWDAAGRRAYKKWFGQWTKVQYG